MALVFITFVCSCIQVCAGKIVIEVPASSGVNAGAEGGSVRITPPFSCDVSSVKASMSKKKKSIEIIVAES